MAGPAAGNRCPFGKWGMSVVRGGRQERDGNLARRRCREPEERRDRGVSGMGGDVADHRVQVPAFGAARV